MSDHDLFWMLRALAEAERGAGASSRTRWSARWSSATVGSSGSAITRGSAARTPRSIALARAGEAARGATLYVTLEPCCHHGKTPPCTDAVIAAGIARVVAAMRDPFPRSTAAGLARLREAGVAVEVGLESEAARRLNAPYLKRLATGLSVRDRQVGDDARRQDRHVDRRQRVDLRSAVTGPRPRASRADGRDPRRDRHRPGRRPSAHGPPARPADGRAGRARQRRPASDRAAGSPRPPARSPSGSPSPTAPRRIVARRSRRSAARSSPSRRADTCRSSPCSDELGRRGADEPAGRGGRPGPGRVPRRRPGRRGRRLHRADPRRRVDLASRRSPGTGVEPDGRRPPAGANPEVSADRRRRPHPGGRLPTPGSSRRLALTLPTLGRLKSQCDGWHGFCPRHPMTLEPATS